MGHLRHRAPPPSLARCCLESLSDECIVQRRMHADPKHEPPSTGTALGKGTDQRRKPSTPQHVARSHDRLTSAGAGAPRQKTNAALDVNRHLPEGLAAILHEEKTHHHAPRDQRALAVLSIRA
ncbi:conserved hypothetical protein [Thermomicrobium roseum DSM 5159]|uniref:Uncharacterized protein n=1 Tax=Thermomicrobium roseum (strain ATCC 27502 / DSM 5159 / P-2) TaxID=309801 RepID=B9KZP3_THERP|nr:conserved hypothetical protein [Thermomicrobium roseum DSM 5159]